MYIGKTSNFSLEISHVGTPKGRAACGFQSKSLTTGLRKPLFYSVLGTRTCAMEKTRVSYFIRTLRGRCPGWQGVCHNHKNKRRISAISAPQCESTQRPKLTEVSRVTHPTLRLHTPLSQASQLHKESWGGASLR